MEILSVIVVATGALLVAHFVSFIRVRMHGHQAGR
jgi:hypothetical protein